MPRGWSNERLPLILHHVTATNEIINMEELNLTIGINQVNSCLSCDIAIMMDLRIAIENTRHERPTTCSVHHLKGVCKLTQNDILNVYFQCVRRRNY